MMMNNLMMIGLLLLVLATADGNSWSSGPAKQSVDLQFGPLATTVKTFHGNSSATDNFKVVKQDGDVIFVGATNCVYILNSWDMSERTSMRINWPPPLQDYELCSMKGKSKDECQNYIRIIAITDKNRILICGTNAFKPRCRHYKFEDGAYVMKQEFDGKGLTPYDPQHNSTYLYTKGELYTATVSDFSAADPLIYKEPLRTEQYDSKILNSPDFVSALEDEDFVFFFFREQAVEYINCGKSVYSRVARVCKEDKGGPNKFGNRWTSYLKSRLNCSIPGDYPFYFNHLQSTSSPVEGVYNNESHKLIYGVFTTPQNSIGGNAICAFTVSSLLSVFDGSFKEQENANSNWLPVRDMKIPQPRPGTCSQDSQQLPESSLRFIQDHSIMDQAVGSHFGGNPIFIQANLQYSSQFLEMVVDPQVAAVDGLTYDVLFIGTSQGEVLKMVNIAKEGQDTVLVEQLQVLAREEPVLGLQLVAGEVLVVARDKVLVIPVERCGVARTCGGCVEMRDPHCGWNNAKAVCARHGGNTQEFIQNVVTGKSELCGTRESPIFIQDLKPKDIEDVGPVTQGTLVGGEGASGASYLAPHRPGLYSTGQLAMAVATSCLSALLVGFIVGCLASRKCRCGPQNPYQVPYLNKSSYEEESLYARADDLMTYYPVVSPSQGVQTTDQTFLNNQNIINNVLIPTHHNHHNPPTDKFTATTLANKHQSNINQNNFNTFQALNYNSGHHPQKIYL